MKTKILKDIRKYYEYRFCKGKIILRRKVDGRVDSFDDIETFLRNYIVDNIGIGTHSAYIRRKRSVRDKKKWEKALQCNNPQKSI